jgi:protein-disulfide isomerase
MRNSLQNKRFLTKMLVVLGAGIILIYTSCVDACLYLKGSIWGIDLKYIGLIFLLLILLLNLLKKDTLCLILLSLGLGGEIFLIGFQAVNAVYCPFCLSFDVVLIAMFVLNFDKTKITLILLSLLLGLIFVFFSFSGSTHPAYAEENFITTFGTGPASIRLYSDYFCGPCSAAEPGIETLLSDLMKKNAIRVTFVDTPMHPPETILYAKYFLYILNKSRSFSSALVARDALYEAAGKKIIARAELESFLAKKNIKFRTFNVTPIFKTLENFIKEDNIHGTPTCVIITSKGKELFVGGANITEGLRAIMETNRDSAIPAAVPTSRTPERK